MEFRPCIDIHNGKVKQIVGGSLKDEGNMADETFDEMLQRLVKGASNKGCEALHFYYDSDGKINYCIVPAEELILVYDTEYQKTDKVVAW